MLKAISLVRGRKTLLRPGDIRVKSTTGAEMLIGVITF